MSSKIWFDSIVLGKAPYPIEVTVGGIAKFVNNLHPSKA